MPRRSDFSLTRLPAYTSAIDPPPRPAQQSHCPTSGVGIATFGGSFALVPASNTPSRLRLGRDMVLVLKRSGTRELRHGPGYQLRCPKPSSDQILSAGGAKPRYTTRARILSLSIAPISQQWCASIGLSWPLPAFVEKNAVLRQPSVGTSATSTAPPFLDPGWPKVALQFSEVNAQELLC